LLVDKNHSSSIGECSFSHVHSNAVFELTSHILHADMSPLCAYNWEYDPMR